jgi:hypothetical protein
MVVVANVSLVIICPADTSVAVVGMVAVCVSTVVTVVGENAVTVMAVWLVAGKVTMYVVVWGIVYVPPGWLIVCVVVWVIVWVVLDRVVCVAAELPPTLVDCAVNTSPLSMYTWMNVLSIVHDSLPDSPNSFFRRVFKP